MQLSRCRKLQGTPRRNKWEELGLSEDGPSTVDLGAAQSSAVSCKQWFHDPALDLGALAEAAPPFPAFDLPCGSGISSSCRAVVRHCLA